MPCQSIFLPYLRKYDEALLRAFTVIGCIGFGMQ